MIELPYIKTSTFRIALIIAQVLLIFLSVIVSEKIACLKDSYYSGLLGLIFLIILLLYIIFVKRYYAVGQISITADKIEIKTSDNSYKMTFLPSENLSIIVFYNGYKGQDMKFKSGVPILTRTGVGRIVITKQDKGYQFDFVANANCSKELTAFAKLYNDRHNNVIIKSNIM